MFCLLTGPSADIKAGRLRVRRALQFSTDRPHLHTNQLFKVLAMASMLQAQRSNAPKMLRLRCIRTNHLILPSHLVEGVLLQCLGGDQLRWVSVGDHLCWVSVGDHLHPVSVGDHLRPVFVGDHLRLVSVGDHLRLVSVGDRVAPGSRVGSISGSIPSSHSTPTAAISGVRKGLSPNLCVHPKATDLFRFPPDHYARSVTTIHARL